MNISITGCLQICYGQRRQGNLHSDKPELCVKVHFKRQLPGSMSILNSCHFQLINFNSTFILYKTIWMFEKQLKCNYILRGSLLANRNDGFLESILQQEKRSRSS